ncbi:MBL fold metallo-hydrolase [Halorarum salinum]|uniref:MBL fold metallo-hydrolase n=1 Tax=Halorarum salinum TaxID=2743089 RepID=A0A7D5LCQ9_9EURY|nr:MBL fold metallo-hydrolase [Halobaculum salinum]QLG63786.1 MBL fold metallo-hydrolase [Halobaculum salinum]
MDVVNVTADAEEFTCNAYFLDGEVPALVDAGTMPGVVDVLREHTDELDRLVLTHQHHDHVGELDAVLDAFDPELYAYADHPRRDHALEPDDEVDLGDETFEAVYTPGHAGDHLSFVGQSALFSGDVVVYNDAAFEDGSFGRTDMPGQSRERLVESLYDLLEHLPDTVTSMYPGHGDQFHASDDESVRDVIDRALSRAERREPKYPEG